MKKLLVFSCVMMLFFGVNIQSVNADIIGIGDFVAPTIIDFNGQQSDAPIGTYYAGLQFINMYGQTLYDLSGEGTINPAAANFTSNDNPDTWPVDPGKIVWDSAIIRAGFFILTNDPDNTTITASFSLSGQTVGTHTFDTGVNDEPLFIGIEFLGGFNQVVINPGDIVNGAFAIDNLMYEGSSVPEPATMLLLGLGLISLAGFRRKV